MKLQHRVAIVTGAGRGIGQAIASKFSQNGAKVIIADVNGEAADSVLNEIRGAGGDGLALAVDVSNHAETELMVEEVLKRFGRIDILVNNAGINRDALFLKMTVEQWDAVIKVNLSGVFNCCHVVAPIMAEQNYGRIISLASVVGQTGNIGQVNYAAAKAGVIGLTKALAREMVRYNVTVNAIAPGFIWTPMTKAVPEKIINKLKAGIPMGDLGLPEDVANAALFLTSDESRYTTGHVLTVNGGYYM